MLSLDILQIIPATLGQIMLFYVILSCNISTNFSFSEIFCSLVSHRTLSFCFSISHAFSFYFLHEGFNLLQQNNLSTEIIDVLKLELPWWQ